MKIKNIINVLFVVLFLPSCTPKVTNASIKTPTLITTSFPTQTSVPYPTSTLTPYPTNTTLPVLKTSDVSGWVVYSVLLNRDPIVSQIFLKNLDTGEVKELTEPGTAENPTWSPDGSQIMFTIWTEKNSFDIYVMDRDGENKRPIVASSASEIAGDWSPDGNKVAYFTDEDFGIQVIDLKTDKIIQLASHVGMPNNWGRWSGGEPHWSPDGTKIAFVASRGNTTQVFVMNADGTNITPMTDYDHWEYNPVWCPDASCIIFVRHRPKLFLLDVNSKKVTPLLKSIFSVEQSEFMVARSPVRGYITFGVDGLFYAMDMKSKEIYPLNIQAQSLSLYP